MKFIVTADWHLSLQQYGDPRRESDIYKAANFIVDFAIGAGYDILLAGDVLDSCTPSEKAMGIVKDLHLKLCKHNLSAFYIPGNHDDTPEHWLNITRRPEDAGGFIDLSNPQVRLVGEEVVAGITAYTRKEIQEQLASLPSNVTVIVMHTRCKEFVQYNDKTTQYWSIEEDFDFNHFPNVKLVVIGDTHVTDKKVLNNVTFVSPGSIEMTKSNEDIKKYFFVFDTQSNTCEPIEILCDYVRIRSDLICSEEDLDNLIATLTRYGVNQKGTRAFVIVYYKPEVANVLSRINELIINNKENVIVQSIVKTKKVVFTEEDKKSVANEPEVSSDNILSLPAFVEKELNDMQNMRLGLTIKGAELLKSLTDKNINPEESLTKFLNI
jgi:DNA repair exonuclease SbcCD nuclease subunit